MDEDKTKRDAFKHIIWNALLCKYFWTVSSKNKKVAFARDVSNLWEACGNNWYGTRQMDYHNNNIGREIYKQESKYKKNFLGWTTGIENPTDARLESVIHNEVEINIFINLAGYSGNRNKQENQAYFEIIKKKGSKNQFT